MKVAIFSDTHDNLAMFKKGVNYCKNKGIYNIIHAGDIISPFTIRVFENYSQFNFIGVFGNNDGEMRMLKKMYKTIYYPPHRFELDGKRFVLTHSIEDVDVNKEDCNFIIHGHTHEIEIKRENNKLIVNPGECCGYLSGNPTFTILDTSTLEVEIINLTKIK